MEPIMFYNQLYIIIKLEVEKILEKIELIIYYINFNIQYLIFIFVWNR